MELPTEIQFYILTFSMGSDLLVYQRVCKQWCDYIRAIKIISSREQVRISKLSFPKLEYAPNVLCKRLEDLPYSFHEGKVETLNHEDDICAFFVSKLNHNLKLAVNFEHDYLIIDHSLMTVNGIEPSKELFKVMNEIFKDQWTLHCLSIHLGFCGYLKPSERIPILRLDSLPSYVDLLSVIAEMISGRIGSFIIRTHEDLSYIPYNFPKITVKKLEKHHYQILLRK